MSEFQKGYSTRNKANMIKSDVVISPSPRILAAGKRAPKERIEVESVDIKKGKNDKI
jgi:hypothetical protein